ncbi:MAG: hypothetical protein J5I50_12030 [Chitinophagaceae bacterium]|nr:hypothetical protein [Chitinophagaceae bacterium]
MTRLSIQELRSAYKSGSVLIDLRSQEEFTSGFVPGSIFFEQKQLKDYAPLFLKQGDQVVFIINPSDENSLESIIAKSGIKNQSSYFLAEGEGWRQPARFDLVIAVDAGEMSLDIKFDDNIVLADLRDASQFQEKHVAGSTSLPFAELTDVAQIADLDEEGTIYLYSDKTGDAVTAASLLKKHEIHNIRIVNGGWSAIDMEPSIEKVQPKNKSNGNGLK